MSIAKKYQQSKPPLNVCRVDRFELKLSPIQGSRWS